MEIIKMKKKMMVWNVIMEKIIVPMKTIQMKIIILILMKVMIPIKIMAEIIMVIITIY